MLMNLNQAFQAIRANNKGAPVCLIEVAWYFNHLKSYGNLTGLLPAREALP